MNIAFRVDVTPAMGTGHLMRCLTLATGLRQRGDHVRFVGRVPDYLRQLLSDQQCEYTELDAPAAGECGDELAHARWLDGSQAGDAERTAHALADRRWDWIAVDHYALDHRWESPLRQLAPRILAVDDLADRIHDCDVLLDQNLYTNADARYHGKVPRPCQVLLGPRYALLRDEFRRGREQLAPRTGAIGRVLVNFGGVDAGNATLRAIDALIATGETKVAVDVVIGREHPFRHDIEAQCSRHGFAVHVQTTAMAELMAAADLAIGAGGTAIWERCCMGLPALTFAVADNQRQQVDDAAVAGLLYAPAAVEGELMPIAVHVAALVRNPRLLQLIALQGQAAVDGRGVARVIRRLAAGAVTVRGATPSDSGALLAWRNDPSVRLLSRNRALIDPHDHNEWFAAALRNRDRVLLVGEIDRVAVGVVRFDVAAETAEASIYLAPEHQGSGLGPGLLLAAERRLAAVRPEVRMITAEVLGGNERSQRLFAGCGYDVQSTQFVKAVPTP